MERLELKLKETYYELQIFFSGKKYLFILKQYLKKCFNINSIKMILHKVILFKAD